MANEVNVWKKWNALGFIPGPNETKTEFEKRVAFCQNLEEHFRQTCSPLPIESAEEATKHILDEAIPEAEELYGIAPRWVPLFFSNHQLTSWQGGCAWIFQLDENTPTAAFLQLRNRFRNVSAYFGLYQRSELIVHELAHVGRMLYEEPQFEEIFAYQSSSSRWRRWLGPLFQSSKESLLFVILLGVAILADFALMSSGINSPMIVWGIELAPVILVALALLRLSFRLSCLKRCLKKLSSLFSVSTARHFIYRLRDAEIKQFSRMDPSEIRDFIHASSSRSFRWEFLKALYPPEPT